MPTTSFTVSWVTSGFDVNTTPMILASSWAEKAERDFPDSRISPSNAGWNPAKVLSKVDLPTPLAPMRQVSSSAWREAQIDEAIALSWCFER